MRQAARWFLCVVASFLGAGCNEIAHYEAEPEAAEHEILYGFRETETTMRAAWLPSALTALDEHTLLYADRGTRKVVAFSRMDRTISVVADLSPYEGALSYRLSGDDSWGKTLLKLSASVVLLAGPGRRLALVEIETGEVFIVGGEEGLLPSQGGRLGAADFSLLSGVGASEDRLFVAFGDRIFSVALDRTASASAMADALEQATLVHEAGSGMTGQRRTEKVSKAQTAYLDLPDWTHFLWHERTLYFWEPPRLMGLRDGRVMDIGGGGWVVHGDDLETARLYGLDTAPTITWFEDAICSSGYLDYYLACVQLTELDFEEGVSKGSVSYTYWDVPELDAFVPGDGNDAYGVTSEGGGIWQLDADGEAELLFGLKDEAARFEAAFQGDVSVSPKAVISPLAVVPFHQQIVTLSPLLGRLTLSSLSESEDGRVTPLWIDLEKAGMVNHIASDDTSIYMVNGWNLERLVLSAQGVTDSVYSSFFKPVRAFGIPGAPLDISPTKPMKIFATESSLLGYVPDHRWLLQSDGKRVAFAIEPEMAFQFPTTEGGVDLANLSLDRVTHIASDGQMLVLAAEKNGKGQLVVANAGKARRSLAGLFVGAKKTRLLSSYGEEDVADGVNIHDVQLPEIQALSLGEDGTIWFVVNGGLWRLDEKGVLHSVEVALPATYSALWVTGIAEVYSVFVQTDGIVKIWQPERRVWEETPYSEIVSCMGGWGGVLDNGLDVYGSAGGMERIVFPVLAESVSCTPQAVYVSGTDDSGKRGVWRAPTASLQSWERVLGGGYGVPDSGTIADISLGGNVGKIRVDAGGTFYAWLKDTCTLWKIDDFTALSSESLVERVVSDDHLCSADALDVSDEGSVVIADAGGIYQRVNGAFHLVDEGTGPYYDIQVIDGEIIALSRAGLSVYRHGKRHSHLSSPVQIGDSWIDFAQPGHATPRLSAYPGERAVVVPMLYGGQIVKLGYE